MGKPNFAISEIIPSEHVLAGGEPREVKHLST